MHNHQWGLLAEYLVIVKYLFSGYLPLKHRWKNKVGEIDIIFRRGELLVFCEVKARSSNFNIDHHVKIKQQQRLTKAAEYFLALNPKILPKKVRFDLAIVKSIFNIQIYKGWIGW